MRAQEVDVLLRKWLAGLPHPFAARDRRQGIRYDVAIVPGRVHADAGRRSGYIEGRMAAQRRRPVGAAGHGAGNCGRERGVTWRSA